MAQVFELQFRLSGWTGGPGLNTWYFTSGADPIDSSSVGVTADEVMNFYGSFRTYLPSGYRVTATGEAKVLEIGDGTLNDVISYDLPTDITGLDASSATSRATMAKLRLKTGTIVNNRRLAGGIYIGPIADEAITNQGQISSAFTTAAVNGVDALISGLGPKLQVWHRPKGNPPGGGVAGDVLTVGMMPVPAVLRRRRD